MPDGTPEFCVEAERELIGAALLSEPEDVLKVALSGGDFRDRDLGTIWEAIQVAASNGNPGIVTTAYHLGENLDRVGAETRLVDLAGKALVEQQFPHLTLLTHPQIIKEWALRRKGLARAQEMAQQAFKGTITRGGVQI